MFDHVIDTPFRVMDKYDVFMDERFRKNFLELIGEHSLSEAQTYKQLIIITHHGLKALADRDHYIRVNVLRKSSNDNNTARGLQQGTIEFAPHLWRLQK